MNAIIVRNDHSDQGTFGALFVEVKGFQCYTAELPWRENKDDVSCIPAGEYKCVWAKSPHFGLCYHIQGVKDRDNVLIHGGNFAGDKAKGLRSDVKGCVLLGVSIGKLSGQQALLESRKALKAFNELMKCEPFMLTIRWSPEIPNPEAV